MMDKPPKIEFSNYQETKEKRKKTLELKIGENTYMIEVESYDFEYPKNIQEESGILGYERTILNKESVNNFIKKYYQDKYKINLEDFGFTGVDALDEFTKDIRNKIEILRDNKQGIDGVESEKLKSHINLYERYNDPLTQLDEDICHELIYSLSNGEYPNKCFTHQMSANYTNNKDDQLNTFAKSEFFLQKIYDIDYIKNQLENTRNNPREIFNSTGNGSTEHLLSNLTIFNTESGEKINDGEYIPISEIGTSKYYKGIKDGSMFACTPYAGFNVGVGAFFFSHLEKLSEKSPSFGFSMNDVFLKEYLEKSLEIYVNKVYPHLKFSYISGNDNSSYLSENDGINGIVQELCLTNKTIQNLIINSEKPEKWYPYKNIEHDSTANEIFIKELNTIQSNFNIKMEDFIGRGDKALLSFSRMIAGETHSRNERELKLPVFIGNDEIPQLQWGHAKYSHYMNEKGFNFFKFKHADHLPEKTKE